MICTEREWVEPIMSNGEKKFIYENGKLYGINEAIYTLTDSGKETFTISEIFDTLEGIRRKYYKEMGTEEKN